METIKSMEFKGRKITLQREAGGMYIVTVQRKDKEPVSTLPIRTLDAALVLFDAKRINMEGH